MTTSAPRLLTRAAFFALVVVATIAQMLGGLDRDRADAARTRLNEDFLARLHLGDIHQGLPRSQRDQWDGRCLFHIERAGFQCCVILVDGDEPMELYNRPATPFVAGFIGSPRMNLFEGAIAQKAGCRTYGIRPEHVVLSAESGTWHGKVRHLEHLGADRLIHMDAKELG